MTPTKTIYKPNRTCDDTLLPPGRFAIVWVTGERPGGGFVGRTSEEGARDDLAKEWIHGGNYFSESKTIPYTAEAWAVCQEYNRQADGITAAYDATFEQLKKKAKKSDGQLSLL